MKTPEELLAEIDFMVKLHPPEHFMWANTLSEAAEKIRELAEDLERTQIELDIVA